MVLSLSCVYSSFFDFHGQKSKKKITVNFLPPRRLVIFCTLHMDSARTTILQVVSTSQAQFSVHFRYTVTVPKLRILCESLKVKR